MAYTAWAIVTIAAIGDSGRDEGKRGNRKSGERHI
jgi:hypothetical protein